MLHMNIHSSRYKCSECGNCFRDKGALAVHIRSHSGEKPFECSVCGKRFTAAGQLTEHRRIHSGEKPHKCHLCEKAFTNSAHLTIYLRVHTGDKPYMCTVWDNKCFSQSSNLQRHERRIHSNVRPHSCSYCGKQFATVTDMKCHVRVHTRAKSFSCRHCSKVFGWCDQLKAHLLKSHNEGTWFTCHICQKKFSLKKPLTNTCSDMKVRSRMFAMNVLSVSSQHLNWNVISEFILTTNNSVVSYAMVSLREARGWETLQEVFCCTWY